MYVELTARQMCCIFETVFAFSVFRKKTHVCSFSFVFLKQVILNSFVTFIRHND